MKKNSIWFLGGLSGGHMYPLFSLFKDEYLENNDQLDYYFFIPKNDLIESIVSSQINLNFKVFVYKYCKPQKSLSVIFFLFDSIFIFFKILFLFFFDRPLKIYSTGGYFSIPFAIFAKIFSIPFFIYHLDVIPGFAGRFIGRIGAIECFIFEETLDYISNKNVKKVFYPIRYCDKDIFDKKQMKILLKKVDYNVIFILGGSQGSNEINEYIISVISILKLKKNYIIHQTGKNQKKYIEELYLKNNIESLVFDYKDNLVDYYNSADLIIARGGAGTIAEIDFFKKKALIIPLQGVASDHQIKNAQLYCKKNKLIKIILSKEDFILEINEYLSY